jgi:hypothetical protein
MASVIERVLAEEYYDLTNARAEESQIDSVGATDDACVGDGLVGEVGRAMRSSISEMDERGAHR